MATWGRPYREHREYNTEPMAGASPHPTGVHFSWRATTRRAHNGRRVKDAAPYNPLRPPLTRGLSAIRLTGGEKRAATWGRPYKEHRE